MKQNAGTIDRVLRVLVGIAILTMAPSPWNFIGAVPVLTGLFGFCPLYTLIGLNTCPIKKN